MNPNKEGRILLAIQAIQQGQIRSIKAAVLTYDIPFETLRRRIKGIPSRCDSTPNNHQLSSREELTIIQYILELDLRRLSPRPSEVQEIADLLLTKRQELLVN